MNLENGESIGLIVLGMHRSGTSLLTKVLEMSGAWLGEKEDVSAKGPDNPTGFWEHGAVRSINQCLLEASGADWDSVLGFDLKKVPQSINQHLLDEAKEIVAHLQTHKSGRLKIRDYVSRSLGGSQSSVKSLSYISTDLHWILPAH